MNTLKNNVAEIRKYAYCEKRKRCSIRFSLDKQRMKNESRTIKSALELRLDIHGKNHCQSHFLALNPLGIWPNKNVKAIYLDWIVEPRRG